MVNGLWQEVWQLAYTPSYLWMGKLRRPDRQTRGAVRDTRETYQEYCSFFFYKQSLHNLHWVEISSFKTWRVRLPLSYNSNKQRVSFYLWYTVYILCTSMSSCTTVQLYWMYMMHAWWIWILSLWFYFPKYSKAEIRQINTRVNVVLYYI